MNPCQACCNENKGSHGSQGSPWIPWREPNLFRPFPDFQVEAAANSAGWGRGQQGEGFHRWKLVGWNQVLYMGFNFVKSVKKRRKVSSPPLRNSVSPKKWGGFYVYIYIIHRMLTFWSDLHLREATAPLTLLPNQFFCLPPQGPKNASPVNGWFSPWNFGDEPNLETPSISRWTMLILRGVFFSFISLSLILALGFNGRKAQRSAFFSRIRNR